jgi:repressor LexA
MKNKRDVDSEVLAVLRTCIVHGNERPSFRAIAEMVGYKSPRSVQIILERLRDAGRILYENGQISIRPDNIGSVGEETVLIPIVGDVTCGNLMLAEENYSGRVRVSTRIAPTRFQHFILKAVGNSMDNAGIDDGDLMLFRQQPNANDGDVIVASIDGEATVKRFSREKGHVVLRPDSSDEKYKPIVLTGDLVVQGIFVSVLPNV